MTSQYAIAIHILSLIHLYPENAGSSEAVAASVGTNPVVVRNVTGLLRRAALLQTRQGVAGAQLTRSPRDVTLLEVYRAVEAPKSVFKIHEHPHPQCPVGSRIQATLETVFSEAQQAMEARLAQVTLADVTRELAST